MTNTHPVRRGLAQSLAGTVLQIRLTAQLTLYLQFTADTIIGSTAVCAVKRLKHWRIYASRAAAAPKVRAAVIIEHPGISPAPLYEVHQFMHAQNVVLYSC